MVGATVVVVLVVGGTVVVVGATVVVVVGATVVVVGATVVVVVGATVVVVGGTVVVVVVVVVVGGGGGSVMIQVNCAIVWETPSLATTVGRYNDELAVGEMVPVMTPVELIISPGGSPVADQTSVTPSGSLPLTWLLITSPR